MSNVTSILESIKKNVTVGKPVEASVVLKGANLPAWWKGLTWTYKTKILKKLPELFTYELVDGKGMIGITREITDADVAVYVRTKKVKAPKVPRVKKEKVAKVSKRVAKSEAKEAEAQLANAPEEVQESLSTEMDNFFGTPISGAKTGE